MFYNLKRKHGTTGLLLPIDFEEQTKSKVLYCMKYIALVLLVLLVLVFGPAAFARETLFARCGVDDFQFTNDGSYILYSDHETGTINYLDPQGSLSSHHEKIFLERELVFNNREKIFVRNSPNFLLRHNKLGQKFVELGPDGYSQTLSKKGITFIWPAEPGLAYGATYQAQPVNLHTGGMNIKMNFGKNWITQDQWIALVDKFQDDFKEDFSASLVYDIEDLAQHIEAYKNVDLKAIKVPDWVDRLNKGTVYIRDILPSRYARWFDTPDSGFAFRSYNIDKAVAKDHPYYKINSVTKLPLKLKTGSVLEYFDPQSAQWNKVYALDFFESVQVFPAQDFLNKGWVYALSNRGRDKVALVKLFFKEGREDVIFVPERADIDHLYIDQDNLKPVAVSWDDGQLSTKYFDPILQSIAQKRYADNSVEYRGSSKGSDQHLFKVYDIGESLARYDLVDSKGGLIKEWQQNCGDFNGHTLPDVAGPAPKKLSFFTPSPSDGLEIQSYLSVPNTQDGNKKMPLAVWLHGGPHERDSAKGLILSRFFAAQGYALLRINYRGSTGLGINYRKALYNKATPNIADDIVAVLKNAKNYIDYDEQQVAMSGFSAGAYFAFDTFLRYPDTFNSLTVFGLAADYTRTLKNWTRYWALYQVGYVHISGISGTLLGEEPNLLAPLIRDVAAGQQKRITLVLGENEGRGIVYDLKANGPKGEYLKRLIDHLRAKDYQVQLNVEKGLKHGFSTPYDAGSRYLLQLKKALPPSR
jgi:pimeloyl-ACP methyl ester carboxylesterase